MLLPSKFIATAVRLTGSNFADQITQSRSGRTIGSKTPGHRMRFRLQTPPLDIDDTRDLAAWHDEYASSMSDVFTAKIPLFGEARGFDGNTNVTPNVRSAASAGAKQIFAEAFTSNRLSVLKPFDFITFANHTKLYAIATRQNGGDLIDNAYNTNGLGQTTLYLTKPLLNAVPLGTRINIKDAVVTVRPTQDNWQIDTAASSNKFTVFTLDCVERY